MDTLILDLKRYKKVPKFIAVDTFRFLSIDIDITERNLKSADKLLPAVGEYYENSLVCSKIIY